MSTEDILKYISNFTQETPVPSPSPTPSDTSSEATGRKRSLSTDGYEEEPALKVPKLELQEEVLKISEGESEEDEQRCSPPTLPSFTGPITSDSVYSYIPGRLSFLNSHLKYPMTVGEINRRIHGPERLSLSSLSGLFRRAKSKNGLNDLKDQLEHYGVSVPKSRGRPLFNSTFTSLTEGEGLQLAGDFQKHCSENFPAECVAEHLNAAFQEASAPLFSAEQLPEIKQKRKEYISFSVAILKEISSVLEKDRPPFQGAVPESELPQEMQDKFSHFACVTHNFGTPGILAGINAAIRILESCMALLSHENGVNMETLFALAQLISAAQKMQQSAV